MLKFIFDRTFAFLGILVLLPVFFVIIILISVKMPDGSPLFIQERIGRGGLPFKIIKFRTMFTKGLSNDLFTVAGDSRVTPLGRILRKYKLDELPQLFNVLVGDMSFVGPRPVVLGYAGKLKGENRKILELRPGITGLATLKYANEEEIFAKVENPQKYNEEVIYPDKIKIDLEYYYNHTFFGDLKIIFKTFF